MCPPSIIWSPSILHTPGHPSTHLSNICYLSIIYLPIHNTSIILPIIPLSISSHSSTHHLPLYLPSQRLSIIHPSSIYHLPIYLSVRPSIPSVNCPPIHPPSFIYSSVHPTTIFPSVCLSTHLAIQATTHPSSTHSFTQQLFLQFLPHCQGRAQVLPMGHTWSYRE